MKFFKIFFRTPKNISPENQCGRYFFNEKDVKITATGIIAKAKIFTPPKDNQFSVYDVTGFPLNKIIDIGRKYVDNPTNKRMSKGIAKNFVQQYLDENLIVEKDNKPKHHVTISNWPEEINKKLQIKQKLASLAKIDLFE